MGETLYWDETEHQIYSHDPIRIERSTGQLLSKFGFKSNSMTKYELYQTSGHIDVEESTPATDSVAVATSVPDSIAINTPTK